MSFAHRYSDAAFNVLQYGMLQERASSLAHHARLVEQAMAALRAFDDASGAPEDRLALLRRAAREVWAYFVQREACGMRDHGEVIRDLAIPGAVLARLGAIDPA